MSSSRQSEKAAKDVFIVMDETKSAKKEADKMPQGEPQCLMTTTFAQIDCGNGSPRQA